LEGISRGLILRYSLGIRLEGLRKTTKGLCKDIWSLDPDFNPGPLEYEAGVLTTQPRRPLLLPDVDRWGGNINESQINKLLELGLDSPGSV
jgi:hypothetical protein